jgi:diguanylate cyclase (GGDEF)-like protein
VAAGTGDEGGGAPSGPGPTLADVWQRRRLETGRVAGARAGIGTERPPSPDLAPGVRRLPRRQTEVISGTETGTRRREGDVPARELWTAPLRSVKVDETESDYEGDRLTRDELTGVLNRQAGFAALGRELDRCRRAGERFVLGYLDVDGLKEVNSSVGPRAGDELLRKVTAALRATLRSYDVIMRLGGDEFLFSLPGADRATAELRANEFGVILAEEAPGASASVGFGELRGNDTLDEIISRAEIELVKSRRSRSRSR